MKKYIFIPFVLLLTLLLRETGFSQNTPVLKEKVGVLYIDSKGFSLDPVQMGNLTRLELDKTGVYEVLDKYDVEYLVEKEGLKLDNCYGKICLVETAKKLHADKMLTGSVELLGERVVISFRLIDIGTESVEKSQVMEFLNLRPQVQLMIELTIRQMLGLPNDQNVLNKLTKVDDYENSINLPEVAKLNLSGPRMGMTIFSGDVVRRLEDSERNGGLNVRPVMFQFGYQFETTYLNQGGLQALFEFIPIITGLDQGQILPSISILHGVRSSKSGYEFAFGPILYVNKETDGFYNNGAWTRLVDWERENPSSPTPAEVTRQLDERGVPRLTSSFVFAFGKSFKSGKMNIPINVFFIPNKAGHRFGLSVGFNGRG
jgi:hypothetical protein